MERVNYGKEEKRKIVILRIIYLICTIASILLGVYLSTIHIRLISISIGLLVASLVLLLCSLFLAYRVYEHNGHVFVLYRGFMANYLKVDGRIRADATFLGGSSKLECTLETGEKVEAIVNSRFELIIDNKVVERNKK